MITWLYFMYTSDLTVRAFRRTVCSNRHVPRVYGVQNFWLRIHPCFGWR